MEPLAWKIVPLGGPMGTLVKHNLHLMNYMVLSTLIRLQGDPGNVHFTLQPDQCTVYNTGVTTGYAILAFYPLEMKKLLP
jgi:hypothetical protein